MALSSILKGQGSNAAKQVIDAALSVGKAALHTVMPDDIEFYLCSLELVDCKDTRIGFLSFSVMREQITESFSPIQTMIKTHAGVVTTFNNTFSPIDINIAGTFGRKFRLLLNYIDPDVYIRKNTPGIAKTGFLSLNMGSIAGISTGVKSGYGMTKILEHIIKHSVDVDANGKPYYLKFCNYSLNTAYLVDVVNFTTSQNMASNCIWNYSMTLRAVSPLTKKKVKNKLSELLPEVASNAIGNGITNIVNGMTRLL